MFKNILVATSGSQGSEAAVSTGLQLAQQHGATVHILYVVDKRPAEPILHEFRRNVGREIALSVAEQAKERALEAEGYVRTGIPSKEISKFANEHPIDLIVLGGQNRRWFDRLFIPSISKKVIRLAHVPVLVVQATAESDQHRLDISTEESTAVESEPA